MKQLCATTFLILVTLLACRSSKKEINMANTDYVASFSKFDYLYNKLKGYRSIGGVSIHFKTDSIFDFKFNCTKGVYHGRYQLRNDTIFLYDYSLPLPSKFFIKDEKNIYGHYASDTSKYFYSFKKE